MFDNENLGKGYIFIFKLNAIFSSSKCKNTAEFEWITFSSFPTWYLLYSNLYFICFTLNKTIL